MVLKTEVQNKQTVKSENATRLRFRQCGLTFAVFLVELHKYRGRCSLFFLNLSLPAFISRETNSFELVQIGKGNVALNSNSFVFFARVIQAQNLDLGRDLNEEKDSLYLPDSHFVAPLLTPKIQTKVLKINQIKPAFVFGTISSGAETGKEEEDTILYTSLLETSHPRKGTRTITIQTFRERQKFLPYFSHEFRITHRPYIPAKCKRE